MEFQHVDVFADEAFSGISLTVFISDGSLTGPQLLTITQEVRHFESAFLTATDNPHRWRAQVLDLSGELDFAGHPLRGAVAVLHERFGAADAESWLIDLPATTVPVETVLSGGMCGATIYQRRPEFGQTVTGGDLSPVLPGMRLKSVDLAGGLDPAVVSTGLRYLVIPVSRAAPGQAKISVADFGRLQAVGAQFADLLDLVSGEVIEGEDRHGPGTYAVFAPGSRHRPPHSEGSAELRDHHPVKPLPRRQPGTFAADAVVRSQFPIPRTTKVT